MPSNRKPSYLLHRPTGQARCRIGGRGIYLGEFNSPHSRQRYEQIVNDWVAGQDPRRTMFDVEDLAIAFCKFADGYYRRPDGTPSGEAENMRDALKPLVSLFGRTLLRDFGPMRLKAVRSEMIRLGWCRTNINRQVGRLKRVFAWGTENELVPPAVYHGVRSVAALRAYRTNAVESEPVKPVDEAVGRVAIANKDTLHEIEKMQCTWKAAEKTVLKRIKALVAVRKPKSWRKQVTRH